MLEFVLVVGPCGAGKTTWARARYPEHAHPDAEELARTLFATPGQFRFHPWTRAVMRRLVHLAADELLARGVNVVMSARGATPAERKAWLQLAAHRNAAVHVVRLTTSPDVCVRRAMDDPRRPATARRTWRGIVDNWVRDWQPPTPGEGHASYREVTP